MPDVTLTVTVPESQATRVVDSFTKLAGARLMLEVGKILPHEEFSGNWSFRIAQQVDGETTKQFCERFLRELGKAVINLVDYVEDENRYREAIRAVPVPKSGVDDDVLI